MKHKRKTNIIATIGPSSESSSILNQLIKAGVNIFRFNLKHSTPNKHEQRINKSRKLAQKQNKHLQIMIDLPSSSLADVNLGIKKKAEYLALSYIKKANEVKKLKQMLKKAKPPPIIIAKIETKMALNNFNSIQQEAGIIMVARGDLGKSVPIEKVPFVQKEIILSCKKNNKKVIVATEMLLSMVSNEQPTRAEVSDVANAVLEGCDAVMLSEETAIGNNPVKAVKIMKKIIQEAESWTRLGHVDILPKNGVNFKFGLSLPSETI